MRRKRVPSNTETKSRTIQVRFTPMQVEQIESINPEQYCLSGLINQIVMEYVKQKQNENTNEYNPI